MEIFSAVAISQHAGTSSMLSQAGKRHRERFKRRQVGQSAHGECPE